MSTVQEIEAAISQLSADDLSQLRTWFDRLEADDWDRQIEEDAGSGKLDLFYERLQQENQGHADLPLHDLVHEEKLS